MKKKLWLIGLLVAVVLVTAAACGSTPTGGQGESNRSSTGQVAYPTTTTTAYSTKAPAPTPTSVPGAAGGPSYGDLTRSEGYLPAGQDQAAVPPAERMIIRTGDMSIVVEDVSNAMQQITTLADTYDGWVVDSNAWQDRDRMMGSITIRVAADRYEAAVSAIRTLADDVRSERTSGYDVTEEYVDLTAQLNTLQASADQLTALMEKAGTVEEILKVQQQLTQTNTQIEQIKGRMQYLEQSSATSSISVSLEQSKLGVEFNASTRTVKAGETLYFYANVSGGFAPYSFQWDFGDGATSTEEAPQHTYRHDGTYTVTLTLTDDHGTTAAQTREDYVNVLAGWKASGTVDSAVNGLTTLGHVLVNILIWLGIFSPVWLVIGGLIFWRVRRRRKA